MATPPTYCRRELAGCRSYQTDQTNQPLPPSPPSRPGPSLLRLVTDKLERIYTQQEAGEATFDMYYETYPALAAAAAADPAAADPAAAVFAAVAAPTALILNPTGGCTDGTCHTLLPTLSPSHPLTIALSRARTLSLSHCLTQRRTVR